MSNKFKITLFISLCMSTIGASILCVEKQNQETIIELERRAREERERQERERNSQSKLEERGQQIGKEANRVVNQTTNELRRFVKKF